MTKHFSRTSLKALTFVVFAYDRGGKTSRLLRHLDRVACDYQVLIFDNGRQPISEHLRISGAPFTHYEYKSGDFVAQHYRAAEFVNTEYVMLLDDDSLPAVNGVAIALSQLQQSPTYCAVHGSTGFFHDHDIAYLNFLKHQVLEDVSRLEIDPIERMQNLYRRYYSRYWNAVRLTSDFQRLICGVAEVRGLGTFPDLAEIVLESHTALQGRTKDIGVVTLWKDTESPTIATTQNPNQPSPCDFWRTNQYASARDSFFGWYGKYFGHSDIVLRQLRLSLYDYSLPYCKHNWFLTQTQAVFLRFKGVAVQILRSYQSTIESSDQSQKNPLSVLQAFSASAGSDLENLSITLGGLHELGRAAQENYDILK